MTAPERFRPPSMSASPFPAREKALPRALSLSAVEQIRHAKDSHVQILALSRAFRQAEDWNSLRVFFFSLARSRV